jgi:hypothetical protein
VKTWFTRDFPGDWTDEEWALVCARYHARVLMGDYAHFCADWDELPVDETCEEFECCTCYGEGKPR